MGSIRVVALGQGIFSSSSVLLNCIVESCSSTSIRNSDASCSAQCSTCLSAGQRKFSTELHLRLDSGAGIRRILPKNSLYFDKNVTRTGGQARAFSMDVTEEAHVPHEKEKAMESLEVSFFATDVDSKVSFPRNNRADDVSLHNPLLRQHRLGCGWLGVILEWEGVIVEDDADLERKAWTALAEEEGRRPPPAFVLKRAEGMKNQQAISEVLCWSRDFRTMKRLAQRKEELYEEMQRGTYRLLPGSREFVETLKKYKIPIAIASTRPRMYISRAIEAVGMEGFFNVVLAAEDVYRGKPDPEMFEYAAERLNYIPERCIVFGNSNTSVEAAHDAFMKCVAVAGKHPVYELGAADLVVRRLDDLSMVDLKNLADLESAEFQPPEPLPEMEVELSEPRVSTMDW